MDKITTALTATEDNAAAIRALGNKLREQAEDNKAAMTDMTTLINKRTTNRFIAGKSLTSSIITFGGLDSDGELCVLLAFEDTAKRVITFCNKTIATTKSPALLVLPKGNGRLSIEAPMPAYALVFGARTVTVKA